MQAKPTRTQMKKFWEQRQSAALTRPYSGYLADESPEIIGRKRFEGERTQVNRWLDKKLYGTQRCLDLGCGTGEWSLEFSKRFEQVDALDWAASMIKTCRKRVRDSQVKNIKFSQGEISQIKDKQIYDFIFVGGVLMYATDAMLPVIFEKLSSLLKPGGLLILRESHKLGGTLYRSGYKLRSGLLAEKTGSSNYAAVYRNAEVYLQALQKSNLKLIERCANRHYKFTDIAEAHLRWLDLRLKGKLSRNPKTASFWASFLFWTAWISLWPAWLWGLTFRRWPLYNDWFVVRK